MGNVSRTLLSEKNRTRQAAPRCPIRGPVHLAIHRLSFRYSATDERGTRTSSTGRSRQIDRNWPFRTRVKRLWQNCWVRKPENGGICINGIDHRKLGMTLYRDLIGSVMQTNQLLPVQSSISASLMPASTPARVERVARIAQFTMT